MAGIADLVSTVIDYAGTNVTKKDTEAIVRSVFEAINDTTNKAGESVTIRGFGTFKNKTRAARTGRNPQDGSTIQIAEKTVLTFKAAK